MTTTAIPTAPARRLLLVDDDEAMREVLAEMVKGWAFAPTTAATFREARDVVTTAAPFTIIVSDYHLPDGNGLEFRDWLKREVMVRVPFLLISGGMARRPTVADNYEFLAKPFRMDDFRDRLEMLSGMTPPPVAAYQLTPAQTALASVYARSKPETSE